MFGENAKVPIFKQKKKSPYFKQTSVYNFYHFKSTTRIREIFQAISALEIDSKHEYKELFVSVKHTPYILHQKLHFLLKKLLP